MEVEIIKKKKQESSFSLKKKIKTTGGQVKLKDLCEKFVPMKFRHAHKF